MTKSIKRLMPIFAFFLMLAGAKAEGDTVSTWLWQKQYPTNFRDIQYSKTDKYIVVQGDEEFYFIDPQNGKTMSKIPIRKKILSGEGTTDNGRIVFINNDTKFLIESKDRKTIDCYNSVDFSKIYSLEATGEEIIDYDVSRDEKQLVARVGIKNIRIWDLASKKITAQYTLSTNKDEVLGYLRVPRFNPEGNQIIVSTYSKISNGTAANPNYKIIQNLVVFNQKLDSIGVWNNVWHSFIWSKSGKYIASLNCYLSDTPNQYEVSILDSKNLTIVNKFRIQAGPIAKIIFTNDEEHFIVAYGVNVDICKVYRIKDGINTINYHPGNSTDGACLSNSGNEIVFCVSGFVTQYAFSPTSSVENGFFDNGIVSFPNPIQGGGILKFNQEKAGKTIIILSDERGNKVKELCNSYLEQGTQSISIDASELANGAYFITIKNDTQNISYKLIVKR